MKYGAPFWRDHSREAPHNLYTSSARLRKALVKLNWEGPVSSLPHFAGNAPLQTGTPASSVDIRFPGAVRYKLRLVYDAKQGGYLRYMDGKLHVDRESGQPIIAKNVLIQRVNAVPYAEDKHGTYDVEVIGSGQGLFLSNGQQEGMNWRKDWNGGQTQYTGANNAPLPYLSGQTWVEIVPMEGTVTLSPPAAKPA